MLRNFVGTDCRCVEHLLLVDSENLAFKSGKSLYFFNINAKTLTIGKRADGSIGAITVKLKHFAYVKQMWNK